MNYLNDNRLQHIGAILWMNFCQILHIITQRSTLIHNYVQLAHLIAPNPPILTQISANVKLNRRQKNLLKDSFVLDINSYLNWSDLINAPILFAPLLVNEWSCGRVKE
jgi:hypothetical protein